MKARRTVSHIGSVALIHFFLISLFITCESAFTETLTITLGDVDGGIDDGPGSIDDVFIDPAWRNEVIDNTPPLDPIRRFDHAQVNQNVPFTFNFSLPPSGVITDAELTLGLRGTVDGSLGVQSDAVIFAYDPPVGPYSYDPLGWLPIPIDSVVIRTLDLTNALSDDLRPLLANGTLNVLIRDDSLVDYAQLSLTIVPEPYTATMFLLSIGLVLTLCRRRQAYHAIGAVNPYPILHTFSAQQSAIPASH